MKTSSASSSVLPFAPAASSTPAAPTSTSEQGDDTQKSFADVLHEHASDHAISDGPTTKNATSAVPNTVKNTAAQAAPATVETPVETTPAATAILATPPATDTKISTPKTTLSDAPPANTNVKAKPTTVAGSDLASMIVQATILASNARQVSPTATVTAPAATATTDTGKAPTKETAPGKTTELDLATLIAQAAIATSKATTNPATSNASTTATTAAANLAQVAATANPGEAELSIGTAPKATPTVSTKEKKSTSTSSEGSFLQSGTATSQSVSSQLAALVAPIKDNADSSLNQKVTSDADAKKSLVSSLSATASNTGGTTNVEKDAAMNASLHMSEMTAGSGTTNTSSPTSADLHIQLSSNHDFNDAIKQVLHVASISETASSRTPLRVAMELQTPPGAIVNVYVSKQADGYRAQLSTNDPAALSWVQDKLTDLRQANDLGVEVKWLPAQIENTTSISSSSNSSNEGDLWNRGGQNQQGQQQEQQQQSRQNKGDVFPGMPSLTNNLFMTHLTALGRTA